WLRIDNDESDSRSVGRDVVAVVNCAHEYSGAWEWGRGRMCTWIKLGQG
ncbi:hypothetical protein Tco_1115895, partial [Tanacetum coccineum]